MTGNSSVSSTHNKPKYIYFFRVFFLLLLLCQFPAMAVKNKKLLSERTAVSFLVQLGNDSFRKKDLG